MAAATGHFITFEGGEGAGKTTVIRYVADMLAAEGRDVVVTREPGGIEIAERIREVILDKRHTAMDGRTEALLYAAARRQHLVEKVAPALERGAVVLCDRFLDSSLAYQGHARGLGIEEVLAINAFAIGGLMPELTLLLDIEPEVGLARVQAGQGREINRLDLESPAFHRLVREGYHRLLDRYPQRIARIDADRSVAEVAADAWAVVRGLLGKAAPPG